MAQNRTIPYGYQIKNGTVVLQIEESEIVRRIYYDYAKGNSYKVIADSLTLEGIRYMPDKPAWNKNMVARILQNKSYNGSGTYPAIVTIAMNEQSSQARKQYRNTMTQELRAMKPLLHCGVCGEQLGRRIKSDGHERWYCPADIAHIAISLTDDRMLAYLLTLQQSLATCNITPAPQHKEVSFEVVRLQNEVNQLLECATESMASIQQKMMGLAALKYSLCEDTYHIEQALIDKLKQSTSLQPKLLTQLTKQIEVVHTAITGITLKNGLTIQKGAHTDE